MTQISYERGRSCAHLKAISSLLYFYSNFTRGNCGLWVMWMLGKGILIISFFENSADKWQNGGTIKNRALRMLRFFTFSSAMYSLLCLHQILILSLAP